MDFPEAEINFGMVMALASANFCLDSKRTDDALRPFPEQYDMEPGTKAILSVTRCNLDRDFTLLKVLAVDDEIKARFPDYETRLMNSYIPCEWRSFADGGVHQIGWFSRVKVVQVTSQQYEYLSDMIDRKLKDVREDPPSWLNDLFTDYNERLAANSDNMVGSRIACGNCGAKNVQCHIISVGRTAGLAIASIEDSTTVYLPHHHSVRETKVHLHCMECNHRRDLNENEVAMGNH